MKLLLEISYSKLERETWRGFPHTTKRLNAVQEIDVNTVTFLPYLGTKMLLVTSDVQNVVNGNVYRPLIALVGVKFSEKKVPGWFTFVSDGKRYWCEPVPIETSNVRVRCQCGDFNYRFSWYDHRNKALYGQPFKYQRKTDWYPPANPLEVPGVCKHIGRLARSLKTSGLFR